jgi:transcriptional regulator with XRE-family HTH domain
MSRVGKRIQDARVRTGVSAKQLAKKLGVSETFIAEVEAGKKIINEDLIKRVEKALEINLDEDIFNEVVEPVENLKQTEAVPKVVNRQMEDAFSHILKKIPVCDIYFKEIYDYKYLPILDKKVEGFNGDKLAYIKVPDDSMRGFRIQKGDKIMVYQNPEVINNSIVLLESDGKRYIRQVKRLDANKVLIISHSNDLKTETRDVKSFNVVGRCIRLEIEL